MFCSIGPMPDALRVSILRRISESAEDFRSLTEQHAEAWRSNDFNRVDEIYSQMAQYMQDLKHAQDSDVAVSIVGGAGGRVTVRLG